MKHYLGIILTVLYALAIRGFAEFNIIEINSLSFLIITPLLIGFIPFFLNQNTFLDSTFKVIVFPLISIFLFLLIGVISKQEDLACFIIIGLPFMLFSVLSSLLLRSILRKKKSRISLFALPIFILPLLLGMLEKQLPKDNVELFVSREVIILKNNHTVWNNLLSVPDLSHDREKSFLNFIGLLRPIKTTYDATKNVKLGYFENNVIINESVTHRDEWKELVFRINLEASKIANSPTLKHVIINKNIEFDYIKYELSKLDENSTKLKLSARFKVHSNISIYAKYWSYYIIKEFETTLLNALKKVIEEQATSAHPSKDKL